MDRKVIIEEDTGKARLQMSGETTSAEKKKRKKKFAGGGLAEATAKLKAKGMKEGGMVVKDKVVAMDKSPNSGLITTKGFGASRRT